MTLRAGGAPVEIDVLFLVEQWPLLREDLRERKAADVAARLVAANGADRGERVGTLASPAAARPRASVHPTGAPAEGGSKPIVLPIGMAVALAAAAALAWLWFKDNSKG